MFNISDILRLSAKTDSLLSLTLDPKQIKFSTQLVLTENERITLALATLIARSNISFLFEYQVPHSRFALATTIGVLLADLASRQLSAPLIIGDVLLITRQVGLAISELESVTINKVGLSSIWEFERAYGANRRRATGRPRVLISPPNTERISADWKRIGYVIIDGTHPLTMERLQVLLAHNAVKSASTRIIILPLGYRTANFVFNDWPAWTFNLPDLLSVEHKQSNKEVSKYLGWTREIINCVDDTTDNLLSRAHKKLDFLSRNLRQRTVSPLLSAWGIYQRLASLSVSLGEYEDYARRKPFMSTIKDRLTGLKDIDWDSHIDNLSDRQILASEWQSLIDPLFDAYNALKGDEPSKFWLLANMVEDAINKGFPSPLIVLCQSQRRFEKE